MAPNSHFGSSPSLVRTDGASVVTNGSGTFPVEQPTAFDQMLAAHFADKFGDPVTRLELSQRYRREGYVKIPNLIPDALKRDVTDEVHALIERHAVRRDILIKETGNTPRYMSTIAQQKIAADGRIIPELYTSEVLMGMLGELANEPVRLCPWEEEKFVIIKQERRGDTHGWHWGDYSFTLIWIIEAPELEVGGLLQCVPHTNWDKKNPRVTDYLLSNPIRTYGHKSGDVYFLRSDTTLHRTTPLIADRTRIILNMCWANEQSYRNPASHETMESMFS